MDESRIHTALTDLQAELAFQGDALRELSDALGAQQKDILLMREQLSLLASQLRKLRDAAPEGSPPEGDERPPHY